MQSMQWSTYSGITLKESDHMYTYEWLCENMRNRNRVSLDFSLNCGPVRVSGLINGISPEDGSGKCWLVTVNDNGCNAVVFVRTP